MVASFARLFLVSSAALLLLGCAGQRSAGAGLTSATAAVSPGVTERFVQSGEVELFVRSLGGGGPGASTLVALHGGPGYSHDYLAALEALASPRVRVVTFDQRGCGRSKTPASAPLALAEQVADIDAVRAAEGAARIIVLGHSWGGLLAQSYAVAHPDRVRALVLVDAMPNRYDDLAPVVQRMRARRGALAAAGVVPATAPPPSGDDCRAERDADLPVDFADPRHPGLRALSTTSCSERTGRVAFESLGHFDVGARLGALGVPVLLVYGGEDASAALLPKLRGQLALAHVEEALLPSCGHYPFLECPDAFFARVRPFVDASAAAP